MKIRRLRSSFVGCICIRCIPCMHTTHTHTHTHTHATTHTHTHIHLQRCTGCLIFRCYLLQKSPIISGSFAERDMHLGARQAEGLEFPEQAARPRSRTPRTTGPTDPAFVTLFWDRTSETSDFEQRVKEWWKKIDLGAAICPIYKRTSEMSDFGKGRFVRDVRFRKRREINGYPRKTDRMPFRHPVISQSMYPDTRHPVISQSTYTDTRCIHVCLCHCVCVCTCSRVFMCVSCVRVCVYVCAWACVCV